LSTSDLWKPVADARISRLETVKLASSPVPILVRAEQLCDLVDDADGIRPDRQALIAALIFGATTNGGTLANLWQEYRTAPVIEALIGEFPESDGVVDLTRYKRRSG
jgi:hypothetical protein